jgi:hypothetical protein
VTGTIRLSIVDGVPPHLIVGKENGTSDQIKFDCQTAFLSTGDFRDADAEDFGAHKFERFLVFWW